MVLIFTYPIGAKKSSLAEKVKNAYIDTQTVQVSNSYLKVVSNFTFNLEGFRSGWFKLSNAVLGCFE